METNIIYNEDCLVTMSTHIDDKSVDCVLTSPPYNTSRKGNSLEKGCANIRYDGYNDMKSDSDYLSWTISIFENFDKILKHNGCILYNLSYSSEKTHLIWDVVSEIQRKTNFIVAGVEKTKYESQLMF